MREREQILGLKKWFEFLDADGSGEIGVEELQDPLVSVGLAKCRRDVINLIKSVDASGNDEISFDEFLTLMKPSREKGDVSNPVVTLFESLKKAPKEVPLPLLVTAYRRKFLMNATLSKDHKLKKEGRDVIEAIERTRYEGEVERERKAREELQKEEEAPNTGVVMVSTSAPSSQDKNKQCTEAEIPVVAPSSTCITAPPTAPSVVLNDLKSVELRPHAPSPPSTSSRPGIVKKKSLVQHGRGRKLVATII